MLLRSQLDRLPPEIRSGVLSGRIPEEEALNFLRQEDEKFTGGMSPALSPEQQQFMAGVESAGGVDAGTGRAAGAAMSTDLQSRAQGIGQLAQEGAFITASNPLNPVDNILKAIPAYRDMQESVRQRFADLTGANSAETQLERELDNAYLEGRQASTALARERGNELEKLAIDASPMVSQVGTSVAALIASRNPALAATIAGISGADIGTSVLGNEYRRGREAGLDPTRAMDRANQQLGVELATEALVPGGRSGIGMLKAFGKQVGVNAAQEGLAQLGSNVVDRYGYGDTSLNPTDLTEGVGRSTLLGGLLGVSIAGPVAALEARATRAEREGMAGIGLDRFNDPVSQGVQAAKAIEAKARQEAGAKPPVPEQLDLFASQDNPTPEGVVQTEADRKYRYELDAKEQVAKQKKAEETRRVLDERRKQDVRAEVIANQGIVTGRGTMAERLREAGAIGDITKPQPKPVVETPTVEPVQEDMFANEPVQETAQQRALREAKERNAKIAEAQAKKERAAKAKARTQAEQEIVKEYPNVTPEQFDTLVGLRTKKLLDDKAAKTKPKKGATVTPTAPVTKASAPVEQVQQTAAATAPDIDTTLKTMEKEGVFSVKAKTPAKVGMTAEDFRKIIVEDESRSGELMRQAIASGKLKIMRNPEQVGFKGKAAEGVHFRDNGEIILFADYLNKDTVRGTLLHEVKHGLDRRLGDDSKTILGQFAGEQNNERYFKEIQNLAKSGNKVAQAAVSRYNNALKVNKAGTGRDEMVSYFLTETANAQANQGILGRAGTLARDIVSATKVGFQKTTGLPVKLDLKDLAYAIEKEGGAVLKGEYRDKYSGRKINTNVTAAQVKDVEFSLIGPSAANWNEVKSEEFSGLVDNLPRKELDASKAKIKPDGMSRMAIDPDTTAADVLDFPDLYKAYPDLADTKVKYDDKSNTSYYDVKNKLLLLGKDAKNPANARKLMLHELQHAIQYKEGFDLGDNPNQFKTQKQKDESALAQSGMKAAARNASEEFRLRLADELGFDQGNAAYPMMFAAAKDFDNINDKTQAFLKSSVLFRAFKKQYDKYIEIEQGAFDRYQATGGEVESRLVEARADLTASEREDMPFYDTLRTSRYASNEGKVNKSNVQKSSLTKPSSSAKPAKADNAEFSLAEFDPTYMNENDFGAPTAVEGAGLRDKVTSAGDALRSLFRGKVPDEVIEMMTRAGGENNSYALRAMNHLNRINRALAATGNEDVALERLKDYESSATREERLQKARALQSDYPALWEAFNSARRDIAGMSKEIVYALKGQGRALSAREEAVIQSIDRNIGNYLTTSYKAFGPKKVRAEHIRWINTTAEGMAKKEAVKEWARSVLFNIDDLDSAIDRGWGQKRKASTEEVEAVYEALVPHAIRSKILLEGKNKRKMMEAIQKAKPVITNEIKEKEIERFVEDLLRLGQVKRALGKAASVYGGITQNRTIVTPKNEVPKVIRDLWGEQDNPVMNVFATLVRQGEYVARARAQLTMLSELEGKYIFKDKPLNIDARTALVQLGDSMGPLAGLWTTEGIKDYLDSKQEVEMTWREIWDSMRINDANKLATAGRMTTKFFRQAGVLGSHYKWLSVVAKPWNWAMNIGGSAIQMTVNGNFNPKYAIRGVKGAAESIGAPLKQQASDKLQEYIRNGVLDSALAGEIQEAERQSIIEGLLEGDTPWTTTKRIATQGKSVISDAYAAMDIWAKVANYEKEKDFITELDKALGTNWTPTQIERKAAERVRKTNFSYDRAWSFAKVPEKSGFTNFLVYTAETFRVTMGNLSLGLTDIVASYKLGVTNPKAASVLRKRGMERVAGFGAGIGAHYGMYSAIGAVMSAVIGAPEEDEKEKAIKAGLAPYLRDDILTLVGINGTAREYFDAGRFDPYGPMTSVTRSIAQAYQEGDMGPIKDAVMGLVIFNEILNQTIAIFANNSRDPRIKQASEELYASTKEALVSRGFSPERADGTIRLLEAFTPAIVRDTIGAIGKASENPEMATSRVIFEAMGGKFIEFKPEEELAKTAQFTYGSALRDARNDWSGWVAAIRKPTEEQLSEKFDDITNQEFKAWSKTRPTVVAAQLAGVPRRVIQEQLTDAKIGQENVTGLINGKFYPNILTAQKLQQDMAEQIKDAKKPEDKAKIRDKYLKMTSTIRKLQRNYKPYEE